MGTSAQPSEKAAVVAIIDPQQLANGANTLNSDYVDMSKFAEALFIFMTGTIDTTVDCSVRESDDTGGTNEGTLSGKTATQLAASRDNKQVVINVKADELGAGKRYVRGRLVVNAGGAGTNSVAALALGLAPRFGPASDDDLADVDEIVT